MNIEERNNPFRRKTSEHGTPLFVFDKIDPTTGVARKVEKTIYAQGPHTYTLYKQTDVFPSSEVIRTITRTSHIQGEDLVSQELSRVTEEEIEIQRNNGETSLRIFVVKYTEDKGEKIRLESVSFAKILWNGANCDVYYNPDTGNIRDISIEGNSDMVTINLEDPPYFDAVDTTRDTTKKQEKSRVFESRNFECILEESGESFLLRVRNIRNQATISLMIGRTLDIDQLYSIVSTEGFVGWEKAIEKVNEYLSVLPQKLNIGCDLTHLRVTLPTFEVD